jgi:hypothetical protein
VIRKAFAVAILASVFLSSSLYSVSIAEAKTPKKTATPIPSPPPKWPPVGFIGKDGVYATIPTNKELIGILSAKTTLASDVKLCKQYACGAVTVAAEKSCQWWEVRSVIYRADGDNKVAIGKLFTISKGTNAQEIKTILMVSREPLADGITVGGIRVFCQRGATIVPYPTNSYEPLSN